MTHLRADILSLLNGNKLASPPAFSGLIHITSEGLQSEGLILHEVHHDAQKMARAAARLESVSGMSGIERRIIASASAILLRCRRHRGR